MTDKLDLRVPRSSPFTPSFDRLYRELRSLPKDPFHPTSLYEYTGDLREYGIGMRLSLFCRVDKAGNHKIELFDVGGLTRGGILREIGQVFDLPPSALGVMRVDFAVDIPELPVSWFRETVSIAHKRFRAAVTGERFYSEMGNGTIQTIYFGKRPNVIRIYDKQAERQHEYRMMVQRLGKDIEPPSFESVYPDSISRSILTRVERQIGGRVPVAVGTLEKIFESASEFEPFANLKILDHAAAIESDSNCSFETHCTGMYLRDMAQHEGMQSVKAFISKHSKRNTAWAWRKYGSYLAGATKPCGITTEALQARFTESLRRQMAA